MLQSLVLSMFLQHSGNSACEKFGRMKGYAYFGKETIFATKMGDGISAERCSPATTILFSFGSFFPLRLFPLLFFPFARGGKPTSYSVNSEEGKWGEFREGKEERRRRRPCWNFAPSSWFLLPAERSWNGSVHCCQ